MSFKTPPLFEVPKTAPSRRDKIKAFKAEHVIETHHCGSMSRKEHPWMACLMSSARKLGYGVTEKSDLFDIIAKVGRLADEAGICVTGETEIQAIRTLCENNGIECNL